MLIKFTIITLTVSLFLYAIFSALTINQVQVKGTSKESNILWSENFVSSNWIDKWYVLEKRKQLLDNIEEIVAQSNKFNKALRVHFQKGSASPGLAKKAGFPYGGANFHANLGISPSDLLFLRYYLRFADNFDFVKGGKLPGLFGGKVHSAGRIPDGTNGFSTRFSWTGGGMGAVIAYLSTAPKYGRTITSADFKFIPGNWHVIEQQVNLNEFGKDNGVIRVWLDEKLILEEKNLYFRSVDSLKIEGILFSTFFGGHDASWATPKDTYIDFANFAVSNKYIGP